MMNFFRPLALWVDYGEQELRGEHGLLHIDEYQDSLCCEIAARSTRYDDGSINEKTTNSLMRILTK